MPLHYPHLFGGRISDWIRFLARFLRLAGPYWTSAEKWRIWLLTFLLIVLTAGQVALAIAFNSWYENFFDALEKRVLARFLLLIGLLLLIIAGTAGVTTIHLLIKRRIQINWRDWLTRRVVNEWMTSGRHYQVAQIPGDHDNPDGRIAEDIRITTEYAIDLAHSLFYCLLLLISFTQILWRLSGPPELRYGGLDLYIPGHMVWVALIYSAAGSAIALMLGWPLDPRGEHAPVGRGEFPLRAGPYARRTRSPSRCSAARPTSAAACATCSAAPSPPGTGKATRSRGSCSSARAGRSSRRSSRSSSPRRATSSAPSPSAC